MNSDQKVVNEQLYPDAMEADVTDTARVSVTMWSIEQKLQKHLCGLKSLLK